MLSMCFLLLVAGFETTVNLIGNCVLALLSHPEQWRALREDPYGLAPKAVEEALRFDPPVQLTDRYALELEGHELSKGSYIITLIGGANRDPEAYDRPDVFDLHRESAVDHLAFSAGIHYCLGRPPARLEAEIAIATLAERMPRLALAGAPRRRTSTTIRGPISVPLTANG